MRALIYLLVFLSAHALFAQTGPAGVGNAASTSLWLRADAGTSTTVNMAAVSQWNDMSGNANNATQATANQQPTYTAGLMNGMPALFFDNTASPGNDLMTITDSDNLDNTAGLTILTVTRPVSIDNVAARGIVSKRIDVGNNQSYTIFYYTNNHVNVDIQGNDDRFFTPLTFVGGRDYVFSVLYDGSLAAGARAKAYVNETLNITTTETAATISNFASPVIIGSMNIGDGRPFGGYISEIIIYRKALNNVERIIAHNYLFAKYDLSSASIPATINDLYSGDDAAKGHYDFEVGGLGLDATGSNTSVSSSVTGGLATSIVAGFETGDYLIYGHTSGANIAQISDTGGMTGTNNARWSRIWYFDVTNTTAGPPSVNVTFDISDSGLSGLPVTASNYVLLTRAGLAGNWTEAATASSITGDQLNFLNVSYSADGYYTLGTKDYVSSPLPVTLLNFTGEFTEKGVDLAWTTASEHNNDRFIIQRSADGKDFRTFTTVKASGNSYTEVNYHAIDRDPFPGHTYYRLMQTDYDGKITNLKTIAVTTPPRPGVIEVIPNPSNGNFWFELPEGVTNSELKVLNSSGQEMPAFFSTMGSRVYVDAQSLPKGLYLLKLISDRGMHSAKFIIE